MTPIKKARHDRAKRSAMEKLFGMGNARSTCASTTTIVRKTARTVTLLDLVQSGHDLLMIWAGVETRAVALSGQTAVIAAADVVPRSLVRNPRRRIPQFLTRNARRRGTIAVTGTGGASHCGARIGVTWAGAASGSAVAGRTTAGGCIRRGAKAYTIALGPIPGRLRPNPVGEVAACGSLSVPLDGFVAKSGGNLLSFTARDPMKLVFGHPPDSAEALFARSTHTACRLTSQAGKTASQLRPGRSSAKTQNPGLVGRARTFSECRAQSFHAAHRGIGRCRQTARAFGGTNG